MSRLSVRLVCVVAGLVFFGLDQSRAFADPITLGATATFTPGGMPQADTFTIENTSSAGVQLSQLTITVPNGLFFDISSAAPGIGGFDPLSLGGVPGGTATASAIADGDTSLTIDFTGFDPGETITFSVDVDRNVDNVNQIKFSGSLFTAVFSGAFPDSPITGSANFVHVANESVATLSFDAASTPPTAVAHTPEPASIAVWGLAALVGYGCRRFRNAGRV